jgi:hypothetical protein
MHITVKWFNDSFNINLHSKEGVDEFLSIKGCRIKSHDGKEFISFPSTKNEKTGKYWNHAWGSDKFQAAVISEAKKSIPSAGKRDGGVTEMADDVPFANPYRGMRCLVV